MLRFWREKARVLGFVASPLVFWVLIGSGFGDLGFFFPGALALTVMFSAVFSTMSVIEDRREGFLLSMLVAPAPRAALVVGKTLGAASLAWVQGMIFMAFGPITGLRPPAGNLLALAAVLFLVSVAFTLLGFLLAWRMDSSQGFHAVMNLILFPLWMVSGALFPLATAKGWMRFLMQVNPMTYAVSGLRRLMDPRIEPGTPSLAASVLVTALCAGALLAASAAAVNRKSSRGAA